MESKVDFVVADMPDANALTIHLIAAVAEYERELISKRTKEALAVAKSRGVKLGNPKLKVDNSKRKEQAQAFADKLKPTMQAYREQGMSQRKIVEELNSVGIGAPRGGEWSLMQVQRVFKRLNV